MSKMFPYPMMTPEIWQEWYDLHMASYARPSSANAIRPRAFWHFCEECEVREVNAPGTPCFMCGGDMTDQKPKYWPEMGGMARGTTIDGILG